MDVVACIEIAVQHSFELAADQLFDHFACPRVMVLVVTHAGGTHAPDVAIAAILAPARLISLHRRTGADLLFEGIEGGLYMVLDPMRASRQSRQRSPGSHARSADSLGAAEWAGASPSAGRQ